MSIPRSTAATKYAYRDVGGRTTQETKSNGANAAFWEAMTGGWGNLIDRMSFDPWGMRQYADWADGDPTGGDPDYYPTTKGYTGHEMLDQEQLIHMNGRVYDPVIGRFLSPDLMIQAPDNTQSFNRYSYVLNNPLSLVDPSGYEGEETDDSPADGWKAGGGQGGGPSEDDMKKLQDFVDKNSNFDSVDELIQEYKENGFSGVQFRSVFGEGSNRESSASQASDNQNFNITGASAIIFQKLQEKYPGTYKDLHPIFTNLPWIRGKATTIGRWVNINSVAYGFSLEKSELYQLSLTVAHEVQHTGQTLFEQMAMRGLTDDNYNPVDPHWQIENRATEHAMGIYQELSNAFYGE